MCCPVVHFIHCRDHSPLLHPTPLNEWLRNHRLPSLHTDRPAKRSRELAGGLAPKHRILLYVSLVPAGDKCNVLVSVCSVKTQTLSHRATVCACYGLPLFSRRLFPTSMLSLTGPRHQSMNNPSNSDSATVSVPRCVESYSRCFVLAAGHDITRVFSPVHTQTTPFHLHGSVTYITSKCPCFETGLSQLTHKRSNRASPFEQAGVQSLQSLFCGAQES